MRHLYLLAGTYAATVTVTDPHGATASAQVQVVVGNPPGNQAPTVRVAADPRTGNAPLRVRFTSAASDPDRDQLMYVWEFGDGGMAGGPSATHTYSTVGTYTAKLTVRDPGGRTASATVVVTVRAARSASGDVAGAGDERPRVALARTADVRRVLRRGLRYRVTCASACRVSALLRVKGGDAERLGRAAARRLDAGASRTIVVRLDRRIRKRLLAAMREAGVRRLKTTLVTRMSTAAGADTVRKQVVLLR